MKLVPQSIRWRIQLWYALLLAVIVGSLLVAFYRNQRELKYQAVDRNLTDPITRLLPRMGGRREPPPPSGRRPPGPGPRGPREERRSPPDVRDAPDGPDERRAEFDEVVTELGQKGIYVLHWNREGEVRYQSDRAPEEGRPLPENPPGRMDEISKRTLDGYREVIHEAPAGGVLVVGTSIVPLEEELAYLAVRLTGLGIFIVGGGFLVGWFLIGRSLRPIKEISGAAHRIAGGDLAERIKTSDQGSELGRLSGVLNETFEKLEQSFEHQVRFTADASHEMRTPIAVILAKSQFALSRERSPEKYRECLQSCIDSAQHMRSLTDALLELSKVDSGEFRLERTEGDPRDLVREVVAMIGPLAEEKKIRINCDLEPAKATFDAGKIRQALLNLLDNAVKYSREGGKIEVTLRPEKNGVWLALRDNGPGIAREDLPHLFERFYRVDKARTRGEKGGTGLGLAITKAIIEAHGGAIEVRSEHGKGTLFEVRLPGNEPLIASRSRVR